MKNTKQTFRVTNLRKKQSIRLILIATVLMLLSNFSLANVPTYGATSITVGAQTGTVTAGTAGSVTYSVTVFYNNNPCSCSSTSSLSLTNWTPPTGASYSFTPNPISLPDIPSTGSVSGTLTVNTSASTPAGTYSFTVNGTNNSIAVTTGVTSSPVSFVVSPSCTAPTISCPGNQAVNAGSNCNTVVTYAETTTGTAPVAITYTFTGATINSGTGNGSGSTFNKGTTTVTLTATNACGNQSCSFDVVVTDVTAPTITCPTNIQVNNTPGQCSAVVNFAAPSATDNCGYAIVSQTGGLASGSAFPVGTSTITFEASDAGLVLAPTGVPGINFNHLVTDNNQTVALKACEAVYGVGNCSIGNCGFFYYYYATSHLTCDCAKPIGQYEFIYSNAGYIEVGQDYGGTSADVTGNQLFSRVKSANGCGVPNTWTIADNNLRGTVSGPGNTSTCSFTITVLDNQPPTITCPANTTVTANTTLCRYTGSIGTATGSDNCGTATISGPVPAGPYSLGTTVVTWTATDAAGNTATCTQSVTVTTSATASITPQGPTTFCQGGSVILQNTPVGDTYLWSDGQTGDPITVTTSGNYTVLHTNSNGCTAIAGAVTVTVKPNPAFTSSASPVAICKGQSSNITISSAPIYTTTTQTYLIAAADLVNCPQSCGGSKYNGSGSPIGFQWNDGINGVVTNVQVTMQVGADCAGGVRTSTLNGVNEPTGTFTATAFCSCGSIPANLFSFNLPATNYIVGGLNTIMISNSGLIGFDPSLSGKYAIVTVSYYPTAFVWSPGGMTTQNVTVSPVSTTNYTVSVSINGCTGTTSQLVTVNPTPQPTGSTAITLCPGVDVPLTVTGANDYNWSPALGLNQTTGSTVTANPLSNSIYTVTSTDAGSCTATFAIVRSKFNLVSNDVFTNCITGARNVTVTNTAVSNDGNVPVVNPDMEILYKSGSTIITAPPLSIGNGTSGSSHIGMTGPTVTFSDNTVGSLFDMAGWQWTTFMGATNENGNFVSQRNNIMWMNGATFGGGTAEKTASQVLSHNLQHGATYVLACDFGWRNDNGVASPPVLRLYAGNTLLTPVTSASPALVQGNFVTWSRTYLITDPTIQGALRIEFGMAANTDGQQLNIDHVTLSKTSNFTYNWNTSPVQTTATATGLTSGTYIVTVSDYYGCSQTASITFAPYQAININSTSTNVLCKGSNTGSVSALTTGGTPGYNYIWNTGAITSVLSSLYAGDYTVTVTDTRGCTKTTSCSIAQAATILSASISKTNVRCGGKATGSATVTAIGGSSPYSYLWDGNGTNAQRSNLAAGTYTVTVTDASGCTKTKTASITQNTAMTLFAATGPGSNEAMANASGGVPAYDYLWNTSPMQTNATATGLTTNKVYKVKVTDSKGCTITATVLTSPCFACKPLAPKDFDISIYPNPTDGIVNLISTCSNCEYFEVKIFNAIGEKVLDEKRNANNLQFDLSTYTKGIYLFDVTAGDKRNSIKIFLE